MRKITKGDEPERLTNWKRQNPNGGYNDVSAEVRRSIRQKCLDEQFYLCAYCCERLEGIDDSNNEHVHTQSGSPNASLDFSNIVASCKRANQCNQAHHGSDVLPVTPLMDECESDIVYNLDGSADGITENAKQTIDLLHLGSLRVPNPGLERRRKEVIFCALLEWEMIDGNEVPVGTVEDSLLDELVSYYKKPIHGKLSSYSPIVARVLENWISC